MDLTRTAIDDNSIARLNRSGDIFNRSDCRNTQSARNNGDMARWTAFLEYKAAQFRAVIIEQSGRAHRARNQNGVFG